MNASCGYCLSETTCGDRTVTLLEEEQQKREAELHRLRGEIEKGRRSGRPRPAAEVLDRLERKYAKLAKAPRK